jgi:ATP phosphoribosyltransferase
LAAGTSMDAKRLKKLQKEFDDLAALIKNSKDLDEKQNVFKRVREIIAEVDGSIGESQKRLEEFQERFREINKKLHLQP